MKFIQMSFIQRDHLTLEVTKRPFPRNSVEIDLQRRNEVLRYEMLRSFFFFSFFLFNWRMTALQYWFDICHTLPYKP